MSSNLVNVKKIYRQIINGVSNKIKCNEMKIKNFKRDKMKIIDKIGCFYSLILEI